MVTGMYKKYNDGSKVSETFCNLKMKNIEQSAITMQKMEGSKPK
jgi:hypothetical protein